MKKTRIILGIILALCMAGYFFIRFYFLRTRDFKPDTSKARSVIDLRPAIIAKLQQLVKDGSDGLYKLAIQDIEPDIAGSRVDLAGVTLVTDSTVLRRLDSLHKAPDDIYSVSFKKMRIEGLGIGDLLAKKNIDLDKISVSYPVLTVYRKKRSYNAAERAHKDSLTLYQRITRQVTRIRVNRILMDHGTFISRNLTHKNKNAVLEKVSLHMTDVLVDSATQYDTRRFLFSRNATISCGPFRQRTTDSLYFFKVDSIALDASSHIMTAYNLALIPRGGKTAFQKKLVYRSDRFDLSIPRAVFKNMDWWSLFNRESFACDEIDSYKGHLYDFVNDSLPRRPVRVMNFPYQIVRKLDLPLSIKKMTLHNFNISYEEYYPPSGRGGTMYFDNISARITNIINIPGRIHPGMFCSVDATALFMHQKPVHLRFGFDMVNYKTGDFTSDLHIGEIDGTVINPVLEPLAFVSIKRGTVQEMSAHVSGNNAVANAKLTLLYRDLHITALKKEKQDNGKLKKKPLLGLLANILVVKNSNTAEKGEPRSPEASVTRDKSNSFFNFAWRAIRLAVFKTVGIPETFAN